jgi:hypothetical protein
MDGDRWRQGQALEKQKRTVRKRVEKEEGWWLKRESQNRKVHRDQRGLGPRLRVSRRAVGAKAQFRAQRAIPRYNLLE